MGIVVTSNISLIKPDKNESIKANMPTFAGWAAQNAANMDTVDSLFRSSTATYSPAWTGSTTNPTLGTSGFVEGKYVRLWPRMVTVYIRIFAGTAGFAGGSGTYNLSLPFAPDPQFLTAFDSIAVGKAILLSAAATLNCNNMVVLLTNAGLIYCRFGGNTGVTTTWTPTGPVTLTNNDRVSMTFTYPTTVP
jgi:hypothetical protein